MKTDEERKQSHREACRRSNLKHADHVRAHRAEYKAAHKKETHEWYMDNRDEVIARAAAWKASHPESGAEYYARHIEQTHDHHVAYYQEHRVEMDAKSAAWTQAHPDLMRAIKAKSQKAHPETARKVKAKRRALGFIPLNQPFEGCNGHHVDRERVVYIPEVLHMSIRHNVWNGRNMDKINAAAFDYLSKQEVAQ